MTRPEISERQWKIAGAPMPPLNSGERVLVRAGGWITGLRSEGAVRVLVQGR